MFIVSILNDSTGGGAVIQCNQVDVVHLDGVSPADEDMLLNNALDEAKLQGCDRMVITDMSYFDDGNRRAIPISEKCHVYVMNESGDTVAQF